jgi:hypothetical protein
VFQGTLQLAVVRQADVVGDLGVQVDRAHGVPWCSLLGFALLTASLQKQSS